MNQTTHIEDNHFIARELICLTLNYIIKTCNFCKNQSKNCVYWALSQQNSAKFNLQIIIIKKGTLNAIKKNYNAISFRIIKRILR